MAIETTPLGFQKPDGNEPVRNGDDIISANAQLSDNLITADRTRLAAAEAKLIRGILPNGTDLNTLYNESQVGAYGMISADTYPNAPKINSAGLLELLKNSGNTHSAVQRITYGNVMLWREAVDAAAGTWSAWAQAETVAGSTANLTTAKAYADGLVAPDRSRLGAAETRLGTAENTNTTQDGRLTDLETLGGLAPGDVSDATMRNIVANPSSTTAIDLAGRFTKKGELMVNPKDYGAVGNGTADDTVPVQQAVAYAKLYGQVMFWPNGGYKTTANIPDLHNVRHRGNGYITRGGIAFFPEPQSNSTNTLHVAPEGVGVSSNDGLSAAEPMGVQTALNKLENYGPVLQGRWIVKHAAGTYTGGYATPYMEGARRAVEIRGVDMGGPRIAPTVIYDRGASTTVAWGFQTANLKIDFYDIAFKNFNLYDHTTSGKNSGGIRMQACESSLWNIHVDAADFGVYALNFTSYTIRGSYIKNCQMGITEIWHVTRATAGDFATRNVIENCFYGLKAKELCTGHGDWNEYLDCDYAVHMSRSSTINASNSTFKRNSTVFVMSGGSTFVELYLTIGTGADKNGVFCRYMNGVASMRAGAENYLSAPYIGMTEKTIGYGKRAAHTGTLSDTQLVALGSFIPGDFQGEGAWVRWEAYGTANMTSASTLLRFRIGGTTGLSMTLPAGAYDWKLEGRMYVTADGDFQQLNSILYRSNGNPIFSRTPRTTTFSTVGFGFGLYAALGGTTDTITVDQAVSFTSDL